MKEFIYKHYLLVTNIICFIWTALCFAGENIIFRLGVGIVFIGYGLFAVNTVVSALAAAYVIAVNIISFILLKKDKRSAVVWAVFGGSAGAMLSAHIVNKGYRYKKAVNIIFSINIWILIWAAVSCIAYGYYGYP